MPEIPLAEKRVGLHPRVLRTVRVNSKDNSLPTSTKTRANCDSQATINIMRDRYLEILIENQPYILMLYEKFADKKPLMLYDIQERRIYAMPYREYRATLSKRSQISLKKQYDRAMADGDIVVFVKDNEKEKLVSYSLPL